MDRRRVLRGTAVAGLLAAPAAALGTGSAAYASGTGGTIDLVARGLVAGDNDTNAAANTAVWEQATLDAVATAGSVVLPGAGIYRFTGPLHLDDNVHYSSDGATLKLAAGANRDLMRTRGFETLWGGT